MNQNNQKIAVSGMGAVTGFGQGVAPLWRAALSEQTFVERGLIRITPSTLDEIRARVSIPNENNNTALLISLAAISEAMESAKWTKLTKDDGLIFATTTGQIPLWDRLLIDGLDANKEFTQYPEFIANQPLGALLKKIAFHLKFDGPSLLVSTACSASTQAIAIAQQWLTSGRVKRVLVGSTEVLCDLTVHGFNSLKLLSEKACKPFDQNRCGINLSEASAFLCLEKSNSNSMAYLSGHGMSLDGFHMTAPHPEGHGSLRAMRQALKSSQIEAQDISWIHAHGTGSMHNDLAEGSAFQQLQSSAPVSSTKAIHGHALGASGVLESVLVLKAIQEQHILRTTCLETPDPKISIHHVASQKKTKLRHVLKNTAGFGGSNAALVFSNV